MFNLETPNKKFEESYETQWMRRLIEPIKSQETLPEPPIAHRKIEEAYETRYMRDFNALDIPYKWSSPGNYWAQVPGIPIPGVSVVYSLLITQNSLFVQADSVNVLEGYYVVINTTNTPSGGTTLSPVVTPQQLSQGVTLSGTFTADVRYYVFFLYRNTNVPSPPSSAVTKLYNFTSFTFTNIGTTGFSGPTSLSGYGTSYPGYLTGSALTVSFGIQYFTVPVTGTYRIIAAGAAGGGDESATTSPGKGIIVFNTFSLAGGAILKIAVGQKGTTFANRGGGGGGSFVTYNNDTPILIAGGGGGTGDTTSGTVGRNGVTSTTGSTPLGSFTGGAGGTNGNGGGGGIQGNNSGAGGGGLLTNGGSNINGNGIGGTAFISGANGGSTTVAGGFGGGGACGSSSGGGGGGGYSGGGGGSTAGSGNGGGGGGSYDSNGTAVQYLQSITANGGTYTNGFCSGHGFVIISLI